MWERLRNQRTGSQLQIESWGEGRGTRGAACKGLGGGLLFSVSGLTVDQRCGKEEVKKNKSGHPCFQFSKCHFFCCC